MKCLLEPSEFTLGYRGNKGHWDVLYRINGGVGGKELHDTKGRKLEKDTCLWACNSEFKWETRSRNMVSSISKHCHLPALARSDRPGSEVAVGIPALIWPLYYSPAVSHVNPINWGQTVLLKEPGFGRNWGSVHWWKAGLWHRLTRPQHTRNHLSAACTTRKQGWANEHRPRVMTNMFIIHLHLILLA